MSAENMRRIRKSIIPILIFVLIFTLSACGTQPASDVAADDPEETSVVTEEQTGAGEEEMMDLTMTIGGTEVSVEWENNEAVNALQDLVSEGPLTVKMSMYGGFEQVGSLGAGLPRNDVQTTTEPGDIVLYSGNQIVVFYGSNSWAYTRLGHITDKNEQELTELLGNGNVEITIQERLFLNED